MKSQTQTHAADRDDIQGLLQSGYGHHTEACFLLLRIKDLEAARAWLLTAPVTSAAVGARPPGTDASAEAEALPETVLQVALSSEAMMVTNSRQSSGSSWAGSASRCTRST